MAKTRYDLRRIRKIYPVRRRSPLFIDTAGDLEGFKIVFSGSDEAAGTKTKTEALTRTFTSAPVVVVSVESDDVNVYVSAITGSPSAGYVVEVTVSHAFEGTVHGFAGNPSS